MTRCCACLSLCHLPSPLHFFELKMFDTSDARIWGGGLSHQARATRSGGTAQAQHPTASPRSQLTYVEQCGPDQVAQSRQQQEQQLLLEEPPEVVLQVGGGHASRSLSNQGRKLKGDRHLQACGQSRRVLSIGGDLRCGVSRPEASGLKAQYYSIMNLSTTVLLI
jgi:hypothetical protein